MNTVAIMNTQLKKNYKEICDPDAIEFLASLTEEQLITFLEKEGDKHKFTPKDSVLYYKSLFKYIKIRHRCPISLVSYGLSKKSNLQNGRLYTNTVSFQGMARELRGLLCRNLYVDLDMKNCCPTLLVYFAKQNCLQCEHLYNYSKNRDALLIANQLTKYDVLTEIFMKDTTELIKTHEDGFFKELSKEVYEIKIKLNEKYKDILSPRNGSEHPLSSVTSQIIFNKENELMTMVANSMPKKCIIALCFDGLIIKNDYKFDLKKMNKLCSEYGIEWVVKEWDNSLKIPDDFEPIVKSYENEKEKFEENNGIILNPFKFMIINKAGEVCLRKKETFQDQTAPLYTKGLFEFDDWLADPYRKEYEGLGFCPYVLKDDPYCLKQEHQHLNINPCVLPNDIYNTGKPYGSTYIQEKDRTIKTVKDWYKTKSNEEWETDDENDDPTIEEWFREFLIDNYFQDDPLDVDWFMDFLVTKLKNPYEQQGIGFLIKGDFGTGKDTLVYLINCLLGKKNDYCYIQNDIQPVLSTVNTGLKNKLIVCINELDSKQGFKHTEQLKDVITREHNHIKELYSDKYNQKNLVTIFCLSNNNNCIKMEVGQRRWVFIYTAGKWKGKDKYWKKIYKLLDDQTFIDHLFSYLMDYQVSNGFNSRDENKHPRCSKYWNMVKNQISPVFNWLKNMDFSDISTPIMEGKFKNCYYASKKELKDIFDTFNGEESKMKINTFGTLLSECTGIFTDKKITINGRPRGNQVIINKELVIKYLDDTYYNKLGNYEEDTDLIEVSTDESDNDPLEVKDILGD